MEKIGVGYSRDGKAQGWNTAWFERPGSWGCTRGMSSVANRIGHRESSSKARIARRAEAPGRFEVRITETQERERKA